jgi:hypothetical protein
MQALPKEDLVRAFAVRDSKTTKPSAQINCALHRQQVAQVTKDTAQRVRPGCLTMAPNCSDSSGCLIKVNGSALSCSICSMQRRRMLCQDAVAAAAAAAAAGPSDRAQRNTVYWRPLHAAWQQRRPHVSSGCSGGADAGCSGVGCGWPPSDASSRLCSCACGSASSPPGASAPTVSELSCQWCRYHEILQPLPSQTMTWSMHHVADTKEL